MSDKTPELLPFFDLLDKLRHIANGGAGPVNEICAKAADAIQAYRITVGDLLDQKLARPTPSERPVAQVREALEVAPRPWSFEEGGDGMLPCIGDVDGNILMQIHLDPYGSPRIEQKMVAMKMAVQAVNAALTARPSDAAVAWRTILTELTGFISGLRQHEIDPEVRDELLNKLIEYKIAVNAIPHEEAVRVQATSAASATPTRAELIAEIERLQQAKRGALQVADERSKENVELRAIGKRASDFIRTIDPFGDHFCENDLRILAGEPTGPLPETE